MTPQPGPRAQTSSLLVAQADLVSSLAAAARRVLEGGEARDAAASEAFELDGKVGQAAVALSRTVRDAGGAPFAPGSAEDLAKAVDDVAEALRRGVELAAPGPASADVVSLAGALARAARTAAGGVLAACGVTVDRQAVLASVSEVEAVLGDLDVAAVAGEPAGLALHGAAERLLEAAGILRDIAYDAR